jgi:histidine triad (HIT) family protein
MYHLLLWLARSWVGRQVIRRLFAPMSFIIPVKRLRETKTLLAFYHPQPAYPFHVLLVPRQAVASLLDLPPESGDFMCDLLDTVQSLVHEFHLEGGYRLIANGGAYQDFPILHFHLVAGDRS